MKGIDTALLAYAMLAIIGGVIATVTWLATKLLFRKANKPKPQA